VYVTGEYFMEFLSLCHNNSGAESFSGTFGGRAPSKKAVEPSNLVGVGFRPVVRICDNFAIQSQAGYN
jgi:hypothetical protein